MPSIELRVDNRYFRIDSADLEMCGKWFMDCITMYPITPATLLSLRVMPFFIPIPEDQRGKHNAWHGEAPDWNCDSRYLDVFALGDANSASDAVRKFSDMLYEHSKKLAKKERRESGAADSSPQDAKPEEE